MHVYAVSAGHNPAAQGAEWKGVTEHSLATRWVESISRAIAALDPQGKVVTIPTGTLSSKIRSVNVADADIAIEVHFNSDLKHSGTGSETLYSPGSSRGEALSKSIQAALSTICSPSRGAKEAWYQQGANAGRVPDAFCSQTHCVAVILEPYFIHELERIEANQVAACIAIARTLTEFVKR